MIMSGAPYLEHPIVQRARRKGFTLHQIGLEKVVDVDGESGASVGDRAGYIENISCPVKAALAYSLKKSGSKGKKCLPKAHECPW